MKLPFTVNFYILWYCENIPVAVLVLFTN